MYNRFKRRRRSKGAAQWIAFSLYTLRPQARNSAETFSHFYLVRGQHWDLTHLVLKARDFANAVQRGPKAKHYKKEKNKKSFNLFSKYFWNKFQRNFIQRCKNASVIHWKRKSQNFLNFLGRRDFSTVSFYLSSNENYFRSFIKTWQNFFA